MPNVSLRTTNGPNPFNLAAWLCNQRATAFGEVILYFERQECSRKLTSSFASLRMSAFALSRPKADSPLTTRLRTLRAFAWNHVVSYRNDLQNVAMVCLRPISAFILLLLAACSASAQGFPEVDYSKLRITLQRSACYGECPDYRVTISGDGGIEFSTRDQPIDPVSSLHREFSSSRGIVVPGTHRTKVDIAIVRGLVKQFEAAKFFRLRPEYRARVTDNPTYVVTIDTGHGSKTVVDYVGEEVGMPSSVKELEDAIDEAAETERWIKGTPDAIPVLQSEHFNFDGPAGLALMTKAAERGDVETMGRLHSLGTPTIGEPSDGPLFSAASANQIAALSWLLDHGGGIKPNVVSEAFAGAVASDSDEAFDRLSRLVDPKLLTSDFATKLLASAARNGNVRMVSYFMRLHPRLKGSANDGIGEEPALWAAAQSDCPKEGKHPNCDHRKVVRMLLDAGSDPSWFHPDYRNSVLFLVSDPQIARMLLARGADPNLKDTEGEPIIFSISDEEVALAMIDAGLDLHAARPADKMTLRGWANYERWPHVITKLNAARVLKSHAD
jgi:Domain of unknown function (DUF6438)